MSDLDSGADLTEDSFLPLPYRLTVVVVLGVWLWGINLHVLQNHQIDTPALIHYKPRSSPAYLSVYRFATALSAPVAASFLLSQVTNYGDALLPNATLIILLLALFLVPQRWLFPRTIWPTAGRSRFLTTLRRISIGGLAKAEDGKFGDVLLADALTSYARPLSELYIAFSMMWARQSTKEHVDRSSIIVVPLLIAYPFAIRFRQCIIDSQPYNALKYATAFPAIALSTLMRLENPPFIGHRALANFWLVAGLTNALYSFYWDVARDWDLTLFQPTQRSASDHPYGLRRHRYFETHLYYAMVGVDLLLRFAWALKLSPHLEHFYDIEGGIFLLELLEVFRRFLWVFFRVETEHIRTKYPSDILLGEMGPKFDED
ncbi:hypothetical protein LTR85_010408 [Meristemomyces frigidus]|nr:hypothetical protein LTR85_010408 [Meristemomyces frigidus]